MYVKTGKASKITGLHPNTLRRYADEGRITTIKDKRGNRLYDLSGFIPTKSAVICYARVSTPKQKGDLDRQVEYLRERYPDAEFIKDIGSGINFKRKGLNAVLERAMQGESITLVITYRDRLARFGYDLIERILTRSKGKIVVLNQINTSPTEELTRDVLAIITVFSSRLHGLRSYKTTLKEHFVETYDATKSDTSAMERGVSVGIQQND